MRFVRGLLLLTPLALWPATASALTLTSRETAAQKIIVIEGNTQSERTIKAGETLKLCEKGCVIRLPDGEDYDFNGNESVSLEEGLLSLRNLEDESRRARGD